MTFEVIDAPPITALAGCMTATSMETRHRYDRTLRLVMWSDAFLSVAFVLLCMVAVPVVAAIGLSHRALETVGLAAVTCGVLLAAFGAVTAVTLMLRMRSGYFQLPPRLWLPLPPGMRPTEYERRRQADLRARVRRP
jgi:Na+/melibiose symporter-like transporter